MMISATTSERAPFLAITSLLAHQKAAVEKLLPARVGALFMDMGTGKSRAGIELIRLRQHRIDRVLWFCPVSLKETIHCEILKHTDCTEADIYEFDDRTTASRLPQGARWFIIGIESMSSSSRAVLTAAGLITDRTFVIVDESSYIKGHRTKRTDRITLMSERARYRLILNGTPISQGVVDLYAQFRFLDWRILGYRSFYSFAANHLEYHPDYPGMIVRAHNTELLAVKIKPYVYQVTKDECLTLPDKLYERYVCSLSREQEAAYRQAKEDILLNTDPDGWDALVVFRLFTALQGIVCGYWAKSDGTVVDLANNRISLLLATLERIPGPEKVIIWTKHHYAIRQIREALAREYGGEAIAEFHGQLSVGRRNQELARWRESARFLLATEGTGGHGLTLTEARYAMFYENGFKYAERVQAEDRIHRIGQERRPLYIDLSSQSGIETRIFDALARKGNALQEFRRQVDRVKQSEKRLRGLIHEL